MTLNDLENTMVVQMRNQQLYLVITDCLPPNASENKDIVFLSRGGYMQGTSYTFNMLMNTDNELYREWDIMKVFKRVYSNFDQNHSLKVHLIWYVYGIERKMPVKRRR